jgi:hypothetical protein
MMGPVSGFGMGPGMTDRDYGRQYPDAPVAPAENDTAADKEN